MSESKRIEHSVDNRFKNLFSDEAFVQYTQLSPMHQQALRDKFKEMFMPSVDVPTHSANSKASKQG